MRKYSFSSSKISSNLHCPESILLGSSFSWVCWKVGKLSEKWRGGGARPRTGLLAPVVRLLRPAQTQTSHMCPNRVWQPALERCPLRWGTLCNREGIPIWNPSLTLLIPQTMDTNGKLWTPMENYGNRFLVFSGKSLKSDLFTCQDQHQLIPNFGKGQKCQHSENLGSIKKTFFGHLTKMYLWWQHFAWIVPLRGD